MAPRGSADPWLASDVVTRSRISTLRSPVAVLVSVVAVATLAAGCTGTEQTGEVSAGAQSPPRESTETPPGAGDGLDWSGCDLELAQMARLECATLEVPLDPAEPEGTTIELAVARSSSTGSTTERLGSLVMNPGGPGGSGIEALASTAQAYPESLTDRFDLVSFDPRGVGASTPVRCLDDATKDEQLSSDLSPDTPDEIERAVEDQGELRDGCVEDTTGLVEHMSTADVAADLDELREALGDEQLTYLGFSYGTAIGAVYASLFPERSRALVLDGATDPDATAEESALTQAQGFERTLASFVDACDADEGCALGPDAAASLESTRGSLAERPVEVESEGGVRLMGPDLFDVALATALYDTTLWGTTAEAIASIRDGGAAVLFTLVDRQVGRQPDGSFDNSSDAQIMVNCADDPDRPDAAGATDAAGRIAAAAPRFGPWLGWGTLSCVGWPEPSNPLPPIDGAGAPPVLVVGTVGDPATPYEWSQQLADALESGVLLTYEGDGHTAFLRGGSCIEEEVVAYLVDLEVPAAGTSCAAESESLDFSTLGDEVVDQFVDAGAPRQVAECVVDGIRDEIGDAAFNELVLGDDIDEFTRLATAAMLRCSTQGG